MELLEYLENREYPTEYLLSRIKGRRAQLIKDWRTLIFGVAPFESVSSTRYRGLLGIKSPEDVWKFLIKEYRWVYFQMNGVLRQIFQPFFLYSELRTIFICLRLLKEKKAGKVNELLEASLLSEEIKAVLTESEDIAATVAALERIFCSLSSQFGGLTELLSAEGLRGVEQRLANRYLVHTVHSKLDPLMRIFFSRLIDSRNIMSLYKHLRLNIKTEPEFLPGGGIAEARLREVLKSGDLFGVSSLIREFIGIKIERPDPTQVETSLYKGITRFLRKEGKDPFGAGPILDYLWRCSIEAMNLSVLFYGKDLEREAVTAEMIQ